MKRLFVVIAFCLFLSVTSFSQSFNTQSYPVGAGPAQLIVADLNGDHIPDLVTVNSSANTVSILINNGDGTFRPQLEFATGPAPIALAAVDWNKDGKIDLVVANSGADAAHSASILIGNGDGTFQPHHDIPGAPNANSIAVGDFNHDGNPDIAAGTNSPVNAVYVSLGDGKGGVVAQKVTTGFGQQPEPGENRYMLTKIVWADFNRDGKDDLYYIQCCGGFDIEFGAWGTLVSNVDGTFTDHLSGQAPVPQDLISVDINQDGLSDVIFPFFGCHLCQGAQAIINNGDGTFRGAADFEIQDGRIPGAAAFDADGDGLKDFVVVGDEFETSTFPTSMHLMIVKQNADGSLGDASQAITVPINAPVGGRVHTAVGDFNHDGKPDLAFLIGDGDGGNNVFVVLNTTPPGPCKFRTTDHTVTLCHPSDGAVGLSPAHIVSHATSSTKVDASQIYLDFKLVFQVAGGNIDTKLPLTPGEHRLEVKSWSQGKNFRNDFFLSTPKSIPATVPPCVESANFAVNICSPGQNATVDSPVRVVAAAKSTAHITTMQIYVDFKEVFHAPNATLIETDLPMTSGKHFMTVKAWDSTGRNFSSSRTINVQ